MQVLTKLDLKSAESRMKSGDVIAFSGNSFGSKLIQFFTKSPISHVAIVSENGKGKECVEANNKIGNIGVYRYPISELANYSGRVWLLTLSKDSRTRIDLHNLEFFLYQNSNALFDTWGSLRSAEVLLPLFPLLKRFVRIVYKENLSKLFCSEFVVAALRAANVIKTINPSEVTPADLCSFSIFDNEYFQLSGEQLKIVSYNLHSPEQFGF